MEPFKTRGYVFGTTLKYIREGLPPERRQKALDKISPETLAWIEALAKPAEMYTVEKSVEMFSAIVASSEGNAAVAEQDLINCGKFAANEASNTFLRLLMKVLTPGLFAKKLPSLYSRDNSKGHVTVEATDDRLVCKMSDVKGYPYLPPVSVGWAVFTLETMGKKLSSSKLHGWSVDTPDVDNVEFELVWRT